MSGPLNSKPRPEKMDDWSKLDYYRFCLFQKQVQVRVLGLGF